MTYFETLSLVIPWLALVISVFTFFQQKNLQKVTAELAKRQLQLIERDEADRVRAKLSLSISGKPGSHLLLLRNVGASDALDVHLESLGTGTEDMLLDPRQVASIFPLPKLGVAEEVKLGAVVYLGSPEKFALRLRWKDTDGTARTEDRSVAR